MPLHQLQIEGDAARQAVKEAWPAATSCYSGTTSAKVYDATTGNVLGVADRDEFAVEAAWVAASRALACLPR